MRSLTFRRLIVLVTFASLFAMATRAVVDVDTWWHLQAGRWMLDHGQLLRRDVFTHTFFGQPWEYPAWLAQVAMAWIYAHAGPAGLNLLTAFFATLAFAFVFAACEGNLFVRAFAVIFAATASAVFWSARPHIISFALGAAFLYLLYLFRARGLNRLWLLPPLMWLWANLHPGFAVGLIFIGLTAAGEAAKVVFGGTPRDDLLKAPAWRGVLWLIGIGVACALVLALTPYGPGLLLFPYKTVAIGALRDFISEWQSPNFHEIESQVFIWLLLALLAAVGLGRRRIDATDLVLVAAWAYLALVSRRNIAQFALVAAPVLARHTQLALEAFRERHAALARLRLDLDSPPDRRKAVLNWMILALVIAAALVKISLPLDPALNAAAIARGVPVGAADFLAQRRPPGPIFNTYHWGGYLSWRLYPDYPVFVDGRTDLYPDEFLREYVALASGADDWEARLAEHGVRLLVIEAGSPLARLAALNPGWRELYRDDQAVVMQRLEP